MSTYWYVLHSKPHKEEMLAEQLELRRIETFADFSLGNVKCINGGARIIDHLGRQRIAADRKFAEAVGFVGYNNVRLAGGLLVTTLPHPLVMITV